MSVNQLTMIKQKVSSLKDMSVDFRVNRGRNKIVEFKGKVIGVYPAMFVIKPDENVELDRFSYSYFDYLCGDINILE